jgi:CMP/dCMP kinase
VTGQVTPDAPDAPDARAVTITVGGMAGTGTSTLSRILADRLGLPYVYTGGLFREEARRRGLTLEAFNALTQQDDAIDRAIDDRQVELLRAGGLILEGRMAGWLAHHHGVPACKVWVVCDDDVRIRRIAHRDGGDVDEQRVRTAIREASELDRYQRYYDADIRDPEAYDLVLDSTHASPQELADRVLAALAATLRPDDA